MITFDARITYFNTKITFCSFVVDVGFEQIIVNGAFIIKISIDYFLSCVLRKLLYRTNNNNNKVFYSLY